MLRKTPAEHVADALMRNSEQRRLEALYKARFEFHRIVGLFLEKNAGRRPQG